MRPADVETAASAIRKFFVQELFEVLVSELLPQRSRFFTRNRTNSKALSACRVGREAERAFVVNKGSPSRRGGLQGGSLASDESPKGRPASNGGATCHEKSF